MGSSQVQGPLWGAAADDWSQLAEPVMTPVYEAVFDALDVGEQTRLFDAGCGSGLALQLAHKRGATVTGLDAAKGLLAVARERVPTADLREGDLEELPFADGVFDAVTSFNAVQFAADPAAALRELRRVAVPGAPVAVVTWAEPERCDTRVVLLALADLLPPPPPGAKGPFSLSAPGQLEALVSEAGLTPTQAGEVPVSFIFADLDTAVRAHLSPGPARRAIETVGRAAVATALRDALEDSIQADGTSRHDNVFRYLIAT